MQIVQATTSDGLHLNGLLSVPTKTSKKIIIHIHGMGGSPLLNSYYLAMHEQYPEAGFAFLATENRGTGVITFFGSEEGGKLIGNALERFEDCVLDIQAWIDFAKKEGFDEIWLQSHSLGTSKVAFYLSEKRDEKIAGTIFLSPSDMIGLVHDKEGMKDHHVMLPKAKSLVKEGKGEQLIGHKLWGEYSLSADTYLNFFDEGAKTAIFNFGDESLGWEIVKSISVPVLAMTGTKDDGIVPVMDAHSAMKKLEKELVHSPRIKTIVFENAQHGFEGFEAKLVQEVIRFVG